jgi:hypothetical protein
VAQWLWAEHISFGILRLALPIGGHDGFAPDFAAAFHGQDLLGVSAAI